MVSCASSGTKVVSVIFKVMPWVPEDVGCATITSNCSSKMTNFPGYFSTILHLPPPLLLVPAAALAVDHYKHERGMNKVLNTFLDTPALGVPCLRHHSFGGVGGGILRADHDKGANGLFLPRI